MKTPRLLRPHLFTAFAAAVLGCMLAAHSLAREPSKAAAATPEQEAKFVATLTNASLTGRWCPVKDGKLGPEKEDTYTIVGVTKLSGDRWQINARLPYGGRTIDLPIPAQVKWAGDTPVLILDNVSMGTSHAYSARVMIYENTYAGWWTASDHGGLVSGAITRAGN